MASGAFGLLITGLGAANSDGEGTVAPCAVPFISADDAK